MEPHQAREMLEDIHHRREQALNAASIQGRFWPLLILVGAAVFSLDDYLAPTFVDALTLALVLALIYLPRLFPGLLRLTGQRAILRESFMPRYARLLLGAALAAASIATGAAMAWLTDRLGHGHPWIRRHPHTVACLPVALIVVVVAVSARRIAFRIAARGRSRQ
jgi:hypothetical protein